MRSAHLLMAFLVSAGSATGADAERWTPPALASDQYESSLTFSPDGREMYFFRGDRSHLYPYRRDRKTWVAQPRIVPKLEVFQVGPLLSPKADRLLFAQADGARSGELFVIDLGPDADRAWPPACAH